MWTGKASLLCKGGKQPSWADSCVDWASDPTCLRWSKSGTRAWHAHALLFFNRGPQAPMILSTLRTTYHLLERHEEAMGMWRASYAGDPEALVALEQGYETGGYSAALRGVADLFLTRADTMYVRPWQVATLLLRGGMAEECLPYLEQAFAEHDNNMPYITVDPIFDPVRQGPPVPGLSGPAGPP